jgi:hypothetical protein
MAVHVHTWTDHCRNCTWFKCRCGVLRNGNRVIDSVKPPLPKDKT